MAKNVQLYDHSGTTKLYPITVAQEVLYNNAPLSEFLNDYGDRVESLEQNAVVADGSITTEKIADGAVTHYKLAEESVYPIHIVDEAITAMKIAEDAVGTYKIQDGAVTMDKLSDDVKTILENGSGGLKEIADGSITTAKLANDAVTKDKIADDAVTSSQIKDGEVIWGKLSIPVQMRIEDTESRLTELETNSTDNLNIVELTQDEYDALGEYEDKTIYAITDENSSLENRIVALENAVSQLTSIINDLDTRLGALENS